jgi:glutamyl-tRNA reductase
LSFPDTNIKDSYRLLKTYSEIKEAVIISTCNRVELYGIGYCKRRLPEALKNFLYKTHEMKSEYLEEYLYEKHDQDATQHLFRVAAGLDSMIIGENQILGQIKRSYERAKNNDSVGNYLHRLLQEALHIGKKVRTLTGISRGVVSMPGAALELIKRQRDITKKNVLVIGAGKIGEMTVSRLIDCGIKEVTVMNRDSRKAEGLKKWPKIRVEDLSALKYELKRADIVITATASPRHIITEDLAGEILGEKGCDILFIDMGVPRNIEESVGRLKGAELYNIDDLGLQIEESRRTREIEAAKAEDIIRAHVCEELSLA